MSSSRIKILIADDNVDFTYILEGCLSLNAGFEVIGTAKSGASAMEMLVQKKPDVLILDIVMPEMDGIEMLRQLNGSGVKKPVIIVLSALGNESVVQRALELGADTFYVKPFDIELLVESIRELYNMRKAFPIDRKSPN
jgi:two-component system response regulator (stage 0 sporulation protein A)